MNRSHDRRPRNVSISEGKYLAGEVGWGGADQYGGVGRFRVSSRRKRFSGGSSEAGQDEDSFSRAET